MKISLTESQIRALSEVLRDDLPTYMRDIVSKRYQNSDEYLDMDVPVHTDKIPNIKVEIKDDNITTKTTIELVRYFSKNILEQFKQTKLLQLNENGSNFVEPFWKLIYLSLGIQPNGYDGGLIDQYMMLYSKNFRLPVNSPDNTIEKPIFSNNRSGIATFLKISKKIYPLLSGLDVEAIINDKRFVGLRDPIVNYQENIRKIQDAKLYLYITDKPDDKLRMSVSMFYDSCQNIYTGGDSGTDYNKKLLSNVFDENSKVAYLIFDSPFRDKMGNSHPFSSIARTIIRVNESGGIMFDRVYPGDMEEVFYKIIENKTGLKNVGKPGDTYHYKKIKGLPSPYMDRYKIKTTNKGDFDLSEKPEVMALQRAIGIDDVGEIEETGDNVFSYDGETWVVDTYESAIEYTRDYLLDSFEDVNQEAEIKKLLDWRVFDINSILSLYSITEDDLEEMGYGTGVDGLVDYLSESGIVKFMDLRISGSWDTWVRRNLNMEAYMDYFGGEWEAMQWSLARYDGILYEEDGYYIYRFDN
jgi:hypothetical protein